MNINDDIWILDEKKISQTFKNRDEIQKPEGGLVEQVTKEELSEEEQRNITLILRGKDVIRINSFPFIIGKSQKANFTIEGDSFISRKHCRITKRDNRFFIEDLQSMNGTFVDGEEIASKTEIHQNSEIILADRRYIAKWED